MIFEMKLINKVKEDSDSRSIVEKWLPKSALKKAFEGEELISSVSITKLKSMVLDFEDAGKADQIDFVISNDSHEVLEVDYRIGDIIKKLFLFELSKEWELDTAINRGANLIKEIEEMEIKFSKRLDHFTVEEIQESVSYLYKDVMYYKMKLRLNVYSKFESFTGVKKEEKLSTWKHWLSKNNFVKLLGLNSEDNESKLVTKDDLVQLFRQSPSPQNAIIPLLIFEGVKLSDDQEVDELRRLKRKDILKDSIIIRDRNGDIKREIKVDSKICRMAEIASMQSQTYRGGNGNLVVVDYIESEYVLKSVDIEVNYSPDSKDDISAITYRGAYSRFNNMKVLAESLGYEFDLTISLVNKSGKIYFINKFMEDGLDKYDAIRKTLMRFGEWRRTGDFSEEKKLDSNRQAVNRLGRAFSTITGL